MSVRLTPLVGAVPLPCTNIEAELADILVIPLPPKRWCQYPDCKTPLAQSNKETLCFRHLQQEQRKKMMGHFAESDRSNELGAGLFRAMKPRKTPGPKPRVPLPPKPSHLPETKPVEPQAAVKTMNQVRDEIAFVREEESIVQLPPAIPLNEMTIEEPMPEPTPEPIPATLPAPEPAAEPDVQAEAVVAASAVEVEGTKEERTPVTEQQEQYNRECPVQGCDKVLGPHNKSGRCSGHAYLKRGTVMKDGSVPNPHTKLSKQMVEAKTENAAAGTTGKSRHKTLPAPVVVATAEEIERQEPLRIPADFFDPRKCETAHVSLKVPVEALDRFLLRLSLEDKTRIVERELLGAL